ncbi:sigma-54 dependent transcriptional regulator [Geobacter sp. DSM 9736]|uniref:sigma-54-dependent transcriptional regulator n=1 Tax=Geobacter sp. DSM 9736 TaxID=1277350 RepID=UPI000B512723|nr:sigma-54 dependent transcriptional regulator [Geobacter sp. DSM 9736]SNB45704.1 DNA-binding transcriptional response regulator, NtrC family, contains REC, AAA-type ATPase, and a Fis-type DNA-binding domains [Geobacter sp. DSM 9736]
MKGYVLLAEDDETFRSFLQTILEDEGYKVTLAGDGRHAAQLLARESFDLVISDLKMPGKGGLELFRETRNAPSAPPFIFLTAFGTVDEAVAAMKEGAVDFLTKPLPSPNALTAVLDRVMETRLRAKTLVSMRESEIAGLPPEELIFAGMAMRSVHKLVHDVAGTTANVLIYGESGTGKELVARSIHLLSQRSSAPFIPLNCAAIPENLLESELFGHEKGAFTGAIHARQGKFELAGGGTIFLDEIGEMPPALQAKLLRVLQERTFERVGGSREIRADMRVIAATNRNLEEEVSERRFREDLFYRLNVFPLNLPPLRERRDAIPLLVEYFLDRFSRQLGKTVRGLDPAAMEILSVYPWPGNVRELQNVIERGVILAQGVVRCENLPNAMLQASAIEGRDSREVLRGVERDIIVRALEKHKGNRRLAAEELGISRRSLQYKLKDFGLVGE